MELAIQNIFPRNKPVKPKIYRKGAKMLPGVAKMLPGVAKMLPGGAKMIPGLKMTKWFFPRS